MSVLFIHLFKREYWSKHDQDAANPTLGEEMIT